LMTLRLSLFISFGCIWPSRKYSILWPKQTGRRWLRPHRSRTRQRRSVWVRKGPQCRSWWCTRGKSWFGQVPKLRLLLQEQEESWHASKFLAPVFRKWQHEQSLLGNFLRTRGIWYRQFLCAGGYLVSATQTLVLWFERHVMFGHGRVARNDGPSSRATTTPSTAMCFVRVAVGFDACTAAAPFSRILVAAWSISSLGCNNTAIVYCSSNGLLRLKITNLFTLHAYRTMY
jgi:hypothetical protein